tara:strand:- start:108 stop:1346 length:1239 start_codon:yes stop_codon:yes gene_type:complete
MEILCDLSKSKGSYIYDVRRETEFLDLGGSFGPRPLGINHPKMMDPEFLTSLGRIAMHKDVFSIEASSFVDKFSTIPLGSHFEKVHFVDGESSALQAALNLALDWKSRRNLAASQGAQRAQIIHFDDGSDGRERGASQRAQGQISRDFALKVPSPLVRFPLREENVTDIEKREERSLQEIEALFVAHPNNIAGIILEPIQSEGGDNYFHTEFLKELRGLCDRHDSLLIFDEVHTGLTGTGQWWDWQYHGVKPDLMVFGARAQVCGIALAQRVHESKGPIVSPGASLARFEGRLVDMMWCQRMIEIIEEDDLLSSAATMGDYLHKLVNDIPDIIPEISNIRGRGLWVTFDFPSAVERDKVVAACFEEMLIVRPCGDSSIRIRPTLDVKADAIGRGIAQLEAALCKTYGRRRPQ